MQGLEDRYLTYWRPVLCHHHKDTTTSTCQIWWLEPMKSNFPEKIIMLMTIKHGNNNPKFKLHHDVSRTMKFRSGDDCQKEKLPSISHTLWRRSCLDKQIRVRYAVKLDKTLGQTFSVAKNCNRARNSPWKAMEKAFNNTLKKSPGKMKHSLKIKWPLLFW